MGEPPAFAHTGPNHHLRVEDTAPLANTGRTVRAATTSPVDKWAARGARGARLG